MQGPQDRIELTCCPGFRGVPAVHRVETEDQPSVLFEGESQTRGRNPGRQDVAHRRLGAVVRRAAAVVGDGLDEDPAGNCRTQAENTVGKAAGRRVESRDSATQSAFDTGAGRRRQIEPRTLPHRL